LENEKRRLLHERRNEKDNKRLGSEEDFFAIADEDKKKLVEALQKKLGYGKYDLKKVKQIIKKDCQVRFEF